MPEPNEEVVTTTKDRARQIALGELSAIIP
jgi:hypothetical protein